MFKESLLFKGDNLDALQWLLDNGYEGKIDLVYIDPPYGTGRTFTIDVDGRVSSVSITKTHIIAYEDTLSGSTFIEFLKKRIELIYRLLSNQGSLYLHIDYKVGHYVKVMLDGIFGIESFRNDITRIKCNPKNFQRIGYGNIKDMVLFYTKSKKPIWNEPHFELDEEDIQKTYNKVDKDGRRYKTVPLHAPGETKNGETNKPFKGVYPPKGRHWRYHIEKLEELDAQGLIEWSKTRNPRQILYEGDRVGKRAQDIWDFKDPWNPSYPTEKNMNMLKFIIKTSSNENSIILDCFASSGSTLMASQKLGRTWIGCDRSETAISTIKNNLSKDSSNQFKYIEL